MRQWLQAVENRVTRWTVGLFMPDLAKQMDAEGLFKKKTEGEKPEYMVVEDNGAEITIFSFSGFDVLYAGFARFEFQRVLQQLGGLGPGQIAYKGIFQTYSRNIRK